LIIYEKSVFLFAYALETKESYHLVFYFIPIEQTDPIHIE